MTVTHLIPQLFEGDVLLGGAERYALSLAHAMSAHVPTRLVTYPSPGAAPRPRTHEGLQIVELDHTHYVLGQRANPISPRLPGIVRSSALVHCHQQHVVTASSAAILGRLMATPVVATDHGGGGRDLADHVSTDRLFRAHLHVSAFSQRQRGHVPGPRNRVLLAGVDTERLRPPSAPAARERVLYLGRVLPAKGVHALIEALPAGVGLDVVGHPLDAAFGDVLRGLAHGRDVRFHGSVDERALVGYLQQARCLVLPSVHHNPYGPSTDVPELLGQVLIEAQACGTPVIASRVGGVPEVVQDGVTGFLVPPGEVEPLTAAIERLGDAALRERMGAAGREGVVSRFSWDAVALRCLEAYRAVGARL